MSTTHYKWFLAALRHEVDRQYPRQQNTVAQEVGISESFLSRVLNRKKIASPALQEKLVDFLGYDWMEFMALGRALADGKGLKRIMPDRDARLHKVIRIVELTLKRNGKALPPEKKAALIFALHKNFSSKITPEIVEDFLALSD